VLVSAVVTANLLLSVIVVIAIVAFLASSIRIPRRPVTLARIEAIRVNEPGSREAAFRVGHTVGSQA
jgi:hypothetical protein